MSDADEQETDGCSAPGCGYKAARKGLCWGHYGAARKGKPLEDVRQAETPQDRVRRCAALYREADSDDDADYQKLDENLLNAAEALGLRRAQELLRAAVREGLKAAKARGVRIGRPPAIGDPASVLKLVKAKGVRGAARELGVSPPSVVRALNRAAGLGGITKTRVS